MSFVRPDAQNQVSGFKGALHRSFPSAELATGWLREHGVNSSATSISQPPTTSLVAQPAASHSSSARPTSSSRAYSSSSSSPSSSSASRPVRLTPRHPQPASSLIYTLYCDGASRGNPGHAGCGFVLFNPNQTLFAEYKNYLGDDQTNNVAEYRGLIGGLQVAQFRGIRYLRVRADSNLICMQTTGAWEVHAEHLRPYREQAAGLLDTFDWWEVQQVPREENKIADRLSNEAIDERSDKVTTWYGDLDQALGADEEEDEDEEEKSEAATGDGTGRGTDARGPMRTKRLGPAGREREDDSVEKIILPLKRHKQTR